MSRKRNDIRGETIATLPWRGAALAAALVPSILIIFRPFGITLDNIYEVWLLLSLAPLNLFLILALHLLPLKAGFFRALFGALTISLANASYLSLMSGSGWTIWLQAPVLGFAMLGVITLWIRQARANRKIAAMLETIDLKDRVVVIESDDERDRLSLRYSDLVAAKAEGNYCRIFWLSSGTQQEVLLRVSLRSLGEQAGDALTPTHRSWMANLEKIEHLHGGAKDLQITMKGGLEVPVSRTNAKAIRVALGRARV